MLLHMTYTHLTRFFRRKIVLFIILLCSVSYLILNFVFEPHFSSLTDTDNTNFIDVDSLIWRSDDDLFDNSSVLVTCRNSVQGKNLVVDDRGFVCSRFSVLATGCCNLNAKNVRYSCETCKGNGCCSIYEFCVSCCLQPNKKELLQGVLRRAPSTFHVVFASVTDHFELCLAKCRTSSLSVQHENSYKDPTAKHCFTDAVS